MCQSVYGVRRLWQFKLHVAAAQARSAVDGQVDHKQAVVLVEQAGFLFQRVVRTHHQPHLLHARKLLHVIGYGQVTHVYGVERTKKQAYVHGVKGKGFVPV